MVVLLASKSLGAVKRQLKSDENHMRMNIKNIESVYLLNSMLYLTFVINGY